MWWSEILAKIPELGLKMSLSEEQGFKVLPLISTRILISKPAAEVLNHFPGNRESHTKMQGQEYQAKVVCFPHLPLITQRMRPKHGGGEQELFGKHRTLKLCRLGRLLSPGLCSSGFSLLNQMMEPWQVPVAPFLSIRSLVRKGWFPSICFSFWAPCCDK